MVKIVIEVGQVFLCKFQGKGNGDLILGKVTRVGFVDADSESAVELQDLWAVGKTHTKKERNLLGRNWLGTEAAAQEVLEVYRDDGKAEARRWAVMLYRLSKATRRGRS
jgi:hypothetical protein